MDCYGHYMSLFGFDREDLHKLIRLLHIPHRNGSVFTGEAVLLFSCYRYTSADSILNFFYRFGRDPTQLTRAFQWFNTFMRRSEKDEQRGYYNGWKKHVGIKYQSIELPCGLSMDLYGPLSFRRHDVDLVTGSPQTLLIIKIT